VAGGWQARGGTLRKGTAVTSTAIRASHPQVAPPIRFAPSTRRRGEGRIVDRRIVKPYRHPAGSCRILPCQHGPTQHIASLSGLPRQSIPSPFLSPQIGRGGDGPGDAHLAPPTGGGLGVVRLIDPAVVIEAPARTHTGTGYAGGLGGGFRATVGGFTGSSVGNSDGGSKTGDAASFQPPGFIFE
jgi:hypothetical protein